MSCSHQGKAHSYSVVDASRAIAADNASKVACYLHWMLERCKVARSACAIAASPYTVDDDSYCRCRSRLLKDTAE